jgi:Inner membrane protein YgaP-like, transmembrane domain
MTTERYIRIIAGTFVLASLALGTWMNHNWYWFTAFVGANLFQSGFTKWCLMEDILRKVGVGRVATRTQYLRSIPLLLFALRWIAKLAK